MSNRRLPYCSVRFHVLNRSVHCYARRIENHMRSVWERKLWSLDVVWSESTDVHCSFAQLTPLQLATCNDIKETHISSGCVVFMWSV